jgi:hypothetical protein
MAAPVEYVRPELFDEAVDRHHRSYVSFVLGLSPGNIRCQTTRTLMPIHQQWILKYVIHIYYLFLFLYNSNCVKQIIFVFSGYALQDFSLLRGWSRGTCYELRFPGRSS